MRGDSSAGEVRMPNFKLIGEGLLVVVPFLMTLAALFWLKDKNYYMEKAKKRAQNPSNLDERKRLAEKFKLCGNFWRLFPLIGLWLLGLCLVYIFG